MAIFPTRKEEPIHREPYEDLLRSRRVKRVYLEDLQFAHDMSVGLAILHLLFSPMKEAEEIAPQIIRKAHVEFGDTELQGKVIELVEGLLMSRFPGLDREELRMKFKLHDIRESKVWKEANEEGKNTERQETIQKCLAKGMTYKQIAELLKISPEEIRALTKNLR